MRCQAIVAGVGGQGVLFAAKVLTEVARRNQVAVLGSQTFGMAQRGGSVMTHVKIGDFSGPLVCEGDADLLLGLDCMEAHRNLTYLRRANGGAGAVCVVNVAAATAFPDQRLAGPLAEMGVSIHRCDADAVALAMGNPLVANLVLMGFGASHDDFPFTYDELCAATAALSGERQRQANLEALARGWALRLPATSVCS